MRGVYTAEVPLSSVGLEVGGQTLILLEAPSTMVLEILSASVTDTSNATNQQMEVALCPVSSLGTPSAATITPSKHEQGSATSSATAKGPVTANEPSYQASSNIGHEGAAMVGGWYFDPLPEERPIIAPSATWGLRLLSTLGASFNGVARITYREIG